MSINIIHFRNLFLNWGSYVLSLAVMFFLSPFIIGILDPVSYGIWSLLNVFAGYMGLMDLGVRASVGRHIALYLGKKDNNGVEETIRSGLGFFSVIGIVMFLTGIVLGVFFPHVFRSIPSDQYFIIQILLPLMAINVWMTAVAAIYSSLLAAYDRFDLTRGVDVFVLIIRTILTIIALKNGSGLWGLAGSVMISNVFAILGNYYFAKREHKELKSFPLLFTKKRLKELVDYGFFAFISKAAFKIIGQTDFILIGLLFSVAEVREYSVGATMVFYSGTLISIIDKTLFPSIQKAAGGENFKAVKWLFLRQLRIAMMFGIPLFIGMATFSKPFIQLWMLQPGFDLNSVKMSAEVMTILSIAKLPLVFVGGAVSVLSAIGYIRFSAGLTIIEAVVKIILSLVCVYIFRWGLNGVAAGTLIATFLVRAYWMPFYAFYKIQISFSKVFSEFIFPCGIVTFIFTCLCIITQKFFVVDSWGLFFLDVILVLMGYTLTCIPFLMPKDFFKNFNFHKTDS